jgi:hypothetical protein
MTNSAKVLSESEACNSICFNEATYLLGYLLCSYLLRSYFALGARYTSAKRNTHTVSTKYQ